MSELRAAAKLLAPAAVVAAPPVAKSQIAAPPDAAVVALAAMVAAPPAIESHAARQPQNHKLWPSWVLLHRTPRSWRACRGKHPVAITNSSMVGAVTVGKREYR